MFGDGAVEAGVLQILRAIARAVCAEFLYRYLESAGSRGSPRFTMHTEEVPPRPWHAASCARAAAHGRAVHGVPLHAATALRCTRRWRSARGCGGPVRREMKRQRCAVAWRAVSLDQCRRFCEAPAPLPTTDCECADAVCIASTRSKQWLRSGFEQALPRRMRSWAERSAGAHRLRIGRVS